MTATSDLRDAARLVQYAFDVRLVPGADDGYAALFERYRIDADFRSATDAVCGGLGLAPLVSLDQGLVLLPQTDSVFHLGSITDFAGGRSPKERTVIGLALLAVAAVAYPRTENLERTGVRRVRVSQVERLLRATADKARDEYADDLDDHDQQAYEMVRKMPTSRPKGKKRSSTTTLGIIGLTLDLLVRHGCARKTTSGSADDPEYQILERYRIQVADCGVRAAHEVLRAEATRAADGAGAGERGAGNGGAEADGLADDQPGIDAIDRDGPDDGRDDDTDQETGHDGQEA